MTAHTSPANLKGAFVSRAVKRRRDDDGYAFIPAKAIDESLEDAQLNAIADERANGPFVRVSLDDL